MPNIQSAKKRVKVIEKKTLRNQMVKSVIKTAVKRFEASVALRDGAAAKQNFSFAVKKIDQAVAKGIIKKNTASRKKAQIARTLNSLAA